MHYLAQLFTQIAFFLSDHSVECASVYKQKLFTQFVNRTNEETRFSMIRFEVVITPIDIRERITIE